MLKKLTEFVNLFMEDIKSSQEYTLNDDEVIYNDLSIAIVPGSFKPPHKGHWEMVMKYVDKVDKVIILISNISTNAISSRPLSIANLKKLVKIKDFIQKNKLDKDEKISEIIDFFDSNIDALNYNDLMKKFEELEKICDQYAKEDKLFLELKNLIILYEVELKEKIFKSIRKAGTREITPETSLQIFEIFINAYNLKDKVIASISESPSPITDTINFVNYKCKNCKILLGVSEKGGDDARWNGINKSIKNETVEVIPSPVQVTTMLSATDVRNNIDNLKKEYFPDKISDEDFEKIKGLLK